MTARPNLSVVHVLWSGGVGGIERVATDLGREQVRNGMKVGFIFGRAAGPFAEFLRDASIPVVDLGLRTGYQLPPHQTTDAALDGADLLHVHGFNVSFRRLSRRFDGPVVFTEHGNFGIGRAHGARHFLKERLKARYLREVAVVAANSQFTAHRLAAQYGMADGGIDVVHNGVNAARYDGHLRPAADRRLRIAFVGRLAAVKRIDRLVDAVSRIPPVARPHVSISGKGPLEDALRERCMALGIAQLVTFEDVSTEVNRLFASADVVILPSSGEAFGLSVVEGTIAGALPIVFADGGGAVEVLPPDGIVVNDVPELASVLERLPGSAALSSDARVRRSEWAKGRFPISRMHEGYLLLYDRAIRGAP